MEELVRQLIEQSEIEPICCLVLGGTDTGKTTRIAHLAEQLADETTVAVVDADIGQSHIGPPTTVAWAMAKSGVHDLLQLPMEGIYFVGDIVPTGHLLPLTVAISQASRQASQQGRVVFIDTGGFIADQAAKVLWWQVCRITGSQAVLAIQKQKELEPILAGIEALTQNIYRIGCPQQVRSKSINERKKFRQERFARYFQSPNTYQLNTKGISIQQARPRGCGSSNELAGTLIALRNCRGIDMTLGVVIQWDNQNETLNFVSPPVVLEDINCVIVGDVRIDLSQLYTGPS